MTVRRRPFRWRLWLVAIGVTSAGVLTLVAWPGSQSPVRPAAAHRAGGAVRHASEPVTAPVTPGAQQVSPPAPGTTPPPTFAVQTETIRLDDPARLTPARGVIPATQGRVLVTDLFVPSGAPGALPLVVFAHGWNSDPGVYAALLTRWAQAGFLVAAPVFPDSTDVYPGSPVSDYADQALDISFVITALLHSDTVLVDPTRIAVAGHSDGGTDVALLALDPAYADARVRAYLSLSGELPSGVAPYTASPVNASLLVAVGSADEYGLYPRATEVFDAAQVPAKVMVVEQGGDHLGSFVGATAAAAAMREETTTFLELALEPHPPTTAALVAALQDPAAPELSVVAPG